MIEVIHKYQAMPFNYHGGDCCQFVGECIESFTGKNPAAIFAYSGEDGANTLISRYGSLAGLLETHFDEVDDPKDGDIAIVENAGRQISAVVYKRRLILRTEKGITDWPVSRALGFWRA